MSALLKKEITFRWDDKDIWSFEDIKDTISQGPILVSPDYSRDFMIFSFTSQDTILGVLLQNYVDDYEHPVAFMSKFLGDSKLSYSIIENKSYA